MRLRPSAEISEVKRKRIQPNRFDVKVLARRVRISTKRTVQATRDVHATYSKYRVGINPSLSRLFDVCTAAVVRVLIQYRITRDPKGKGKQNIGVKQKIDAQIHSKSLTYGVEKACREKRRLRSEAQLSPRSTSSVGFETHCDFTRRFVLPSTPSVEWPRYKERDARFAAGLESSFSSFG